MLDIICAFVKMIAICVLNACVPARLMGTDSCFSARAAGILVSFRELNRKLYKLCVQVAVCTWIIQAQHINL